MRDECASCSTLSVNWPSEFNWKKRWFFSLQKWIYIFNASIDIQSIGNDNRRPTTAHITHKNPHRHLINAIQFHFALQSKVHFLLRNLWSKIVSNEIETKSTLRIDFFPSSSFACDEKHFRRIFLAEKHSVSVLFVSIVVFYQQPS